MSKVNFGSRKGMERLGWRAVLPVLLLGASMLFFSCQSDQPAAPLDPPPTDFRKFDAPQDDLDSLQYKPSFEPDYNNLTPQPWVEPATQAQTDDVSVFADRIEFPASHTEVLDWQAGRIVVAAPGKGAGMNGLGFARKVSSVMASGDKIVVMTVAPALEEILQGDFQMTFDPDKGEDVDLSKVDQQWVADNLYAQTPDVDNMPGELLTDDYPPDTEPMSFFSKLVKKVTKGITSVVKAVAKVAKEVYLAVTPATLNVSGSIKPSITFGKKDDLMILKDFKKTFKTKSNNNVELDLNAKYSYDANVTLSAGVQVGAKIGVPGHGQSSQVRLNFEALEKASLIEDLALKATLSSVDGHVASQIEEYLNSKADKGQEVLNSFKEKLLGDPDTKPSSTWKKTLWMSKPKEQTLFAGPVPVVLTETLQVDLECGFEARGSINAHFEVAQSASFKFGVMYDTGTNKVTHTGPTFDKKFTHNINVLGQGVLTVTCGLIPRVNVFVYDTVGVFAGIRGSAVGTAKYTTKCDPKSFYPEGKVNLRLSANLGLQIGGRLQAPGSSLFGKKGQVAGFDIGPLEPFSIDIKLYEHDWTFAHGLGLCLSTCFNKTRDFGETDIDCGGDCVACVTGKHCAVNSDCETTRCNGVLCGPDTCADKVQDGVETDIDCGGNACTKCAAGKDCEVDSDCATGFCSGKTSPTPGVCVTAHCADAVKDADEDGVDCASKDCPKCADGTVVTRADSCMSGLWNGRTCVASSCTDNLKGGDESDRDCGGSCAARCGFQLGCSATSDCAKGLACHATRHVCLRDQGTACAGNSECLSGICAGNVCQASQPSCQAVVQNVPGAKDGNYTLFVGGDVSKPWTAYCKDMATAPKEYLTLPTAGANYSQYTAGGASPGTNVRTSYTKIRIDPATFMVDSKDQTFSMSTGRLTHSTTPVSSMPYGVAMDCKAAGSTTGVASINLTGTPFTVDWTQFVPGGFAPAGTNLHSVDNRVVSLGGGGACGWMAVSGSGNPFNTNGKPIQLQYAP